MKAKIKCHKKQFFVVYYIRGGCLSMSSTKIYAKDFLRNFDFYHLAKQFYRYTYRYPKLANDKRWEELKIETENFLVSHRMKRDSEMDPDDYRDFLRFYTSLEVKYEDPTPEFIFSESEINIFQKVIKMVSK